LWFKKGGQLLCLADGAMHFLNPIVSGFDYARVLPGEVNYICEKVQLLNSSIEWNIPGEKGARKLKTEYNTTREQLYFPVIDFFRGPRRAEADVLAERNREYEYLINRNFKLMNLGTEGYNREESTAHIYQEPIEKSYKVFTKKVTGGILFVFTPSEIVVVEDIEYGTIHYFMKKTAVQDFRVELKEEWGVATFVFNGAELSFPINPANAHELKNLVAL